MCSFLSFNIGIKEKNYGQIYVGDFKNHENIEGDNNLLPEESRECEWTGEDAESLEIRTIETDPKDLKATILSKYPNRMSLIKVLLKRKHTRSLDLRGTQIKELPADLTVGGSLYLSGTQIKELPAGLKVGGSLDLRGTQIKELPADLTVGGSLYLSGTQIEELPAGLKVGGSLDLSGTQIEELPAGLKVGGWLYLSGTQIKELPADLTVGGQIFR